MKLSYLMTSLAGALISVSAQAGDFKDAAALCESYTNQKYKQECTSTVNALDWAYFDKDALKACKANIFENLRTECIETIAGKKYESYETNSCQSFVAGTEVTACLKYAGTAHGQAAPTPYVPSPDNEKDYVVGEVNTWVKAGAMRISQSTSQTVTFNLDSQTAVAEFLLIVNQADAKVLKVTGVTASGKVVQLSKLEKVVGKGTSQKIRLDQKYAIYLEKVSFELMSTELFGERAHTQFMIGYSK